jgi:hypothetical protein
MLSYRVRTIFAMTVAAFAPVSIVLGQQAKAPTPSVSELLTKLKSSDGDVRAKAYQQLRSSPAALQSPDVRTAFIDLLDRENRDSELIRRTGGGGENEGDAEYVADLARTVESVANWNDTRQACILVASGALPTDKYAEHAKVAIPCLLSRSKSNFALERRQTAELLLEVLAKKKTNLDPSMIEASKQVVQMALHDPDSGVRIGTVHALAEFGGEDMIPALRQIAESDPYVDTDNHSFWIRDYAHQAIDAIEQRVAKH